MIWVFSMHNSLFSYMFNITRREARAAVQGATCFWRSVSRVEGNDLLGEVKIVAVRRDGHFFQPFSFQ